MLSILEKWIPDEYFLSSPEIAKLILDGVLFVLTTKTGHLFLPIVFVKSLLKSFRGFNHGQLTLMKCFQFFGWSDFKVQTEFLKII
jgi:hypothetical protein